MKLKIILAPLFLSSMMDYTTTHANPLRKNIPFVERQQTFTLNVARLIIYINQQGYKCTFGETYRPIEMSKIYTRTGRGVLDSNHLYKLAVDLNLFDSDGKYVVDFKSYEQFGVFWEKLNAFNEWGGRWKHLVDSCHFEMD